MSMMSVAGEAWPSHLDGRTTLPRPRDLAASYAHLARLAVTPGIPAPAGSARPVPGSDYRQSSSTSTISSSAPHPLEHMVLASGEVGAQLLGIDTPYSRPQTAGAHVTRASVGPIHSGNTGVRPLPASCRSR